jgi:regulator of sirC expression with transglutaminase-like and TPR domain
VTDATARFVQIVGGEEAAAPLDELSFLIAAHAHPALDVAAQLLRLDQLAEQVGDPTLDGVRRLLFRDLGFTGNDIDYHDPSNSFLDDVLDRRTGLPITLSVVLMEVGRRVGVPLAGVSMPGHFLVRDKVDPEVFVDPFHGGMELDRRACQVRFKTVYGPDAVFDDAFLEPVGKYAIVDRMLANLEGLALRRGDLAMAVWVLRLRSAIPGADEELVARARAAASKLN